MAAPSEKMVGVGEDSSSSDDEVLRRCQEAVWETKPDKKKDGDSIVPQSKRVVVAEHEHDGNELQVTKGFQTHVAKKLGSFLDSYITEKQIENSTCVDPTKCEDDDDDDEGFRLFSSSVPGTKADDPPAPVRRRPLPSSSDSDSEMETRLREAAVSVKDLLPSAAEPSSLSTPSAEPPSSEKIKKKKKVAEEEESHVVKKKKKTGTNQEESDSEASHNNANLEAEHTGTKVKRKKKKKQKEELNMAD
ncbi:protein CUSTOS isoform X2 [Halichoeres trimaculatus]|uniref:protein CUSTOS isoform X2 n=1 Tax=Halichoeres trimaculatus TaxID=147232 RepID=UPI003D9E43FB